MTVADAGPGARRVDAGGVVLHVEERGAGTPVLLLHGFAGNGRGLAPLAQALATRHRVLVPDLVGHGLSDAPHDPVHYGWTAVLLQLRRVLDACAVDRAHLCGFSLGGRVALQLAAQHDDRVRAVVTIGSRCAWPDAAERALRHAKDDELAGRIATLGIAALATPDVAREALAAAAPRAGAHGLALALRGLGAADQPDVTASLARTSVPVCLVAGAQDHGPLDAAHALAGKLPSARVVEIAGAGHRAHVARPDEIARAVLGFLAEADAAQGKDGARRAGRAAGAQGGG